MRSVAEPWARIVLLTMPAGSVAIAGPCNNNQYPTASDSPSRDGRSESLICSSPVVSRTSLIVVRHERRTLLRGRHADRGRARPNGPSPRPTAAPATALELAIAAAHAAP